MQVAEMDLTFDSSVARVAGLSVNMTFFHAATGQPEREAA